MPPWQATRSADESVRLSPESWLNAALDTLIEEGIEAVQITKLANSLGVTRGSFYWHFNDRGMLLDQLIGVWRTKNTEVMIDGLKNSTSLTDGILRLFSVWVDHRKFDPRLDQAVRDWARRSETVLAVVSKEDDDRIDAIAKFFQKFGYKETEAFIRARVIYFTQISYYALNIKEPMETRMGFLSAYFRCFTGQEIDEAVVANYRERMIAWWENEK